MSIGRRRGFKSWFVEPYQQIKLGLMFLFLNIIFSLIITFVFGYFLWDIYSTLVHYFKLDAGQSIITMAKFSTPIWLCVVLVLAFVFLTIMISVRYTHRIYGPLVSITRFLDDWIENKSPAPLKLRDNDELKGLAQRLNLLGEAQTSSQRQSGLIPVYRYLDSIIEGDIPEKPLSLREDDRFDELAKRINTVTEILRTSKNSSN